MPRPPRKPRARLQKQPKPKVAFSFHGTVNGKRLTAETLADALSGVISDPILDLGLSFVRAFVPNFDQLLNDLRREMRGPHSLPPHSMKSVDPPAPPKWRFELGFVGVASVTKEQVNERFRQMARKFHPDAGGDPTTFIRLVAARDAALQELSA